MCGGSIPPGGTHQTRDVSPSRSGGSSATSVTSTLIVRVCGWKAICNCRLSNSAWSSGWSGIVASENRVQRLCSSHGIFSVLAKRKRGGMRPGPAVHDDLVRRVFTAARPNALWLVDITEHRTDEGKLYLCAVKDVFSNRIVGYSIDRRM